MTLITGRQLIRWIIGAAILWAMIALIGGQPWNAALIAVGFLVLALASTAIRNRRTRQQHNN